MRRLCLLLLLAGLQACSPAGEKPPGAADAPDRCAGREDAVALLICRDANLSATEADVSRLYQRVLARAGHSEKTALRAAYAEWQRELAACGDLDEDERRGCVDTLFSDRIVELQRRLSDLTG